MKRVPTPVPPTPGSALRAARAWLRGGWRAVHDVEPEFWRNLRTTRALAHPMKPVPTPLEVSPGGEPKP